MTGRSAVTESSKQETVTDKNNGLSTVSENSPGIQGLMNRLHSALDFHQLIVTFIDEVRRALPCDSIEYRHDRIKLYFNDGLSSQHSCEYELRRDEELLGEIRFTRGSVFQERELAIIEVMVGGLIPPLRNALKYQQAIRFAQRDELTGLRNGSYFHDSVEIEIKRARRYQIPFSLLLIDLDNFRVINETCSRAAGDAVLVEMARRTERAARDSDIVFRNSGDRFLVFLPNTDAIEAAAVAEKLKRSVQAESCNYRNFDIQLTVSIGVVTVSSEDNRYKLTDRVDRALFHAKILGKDRIHVEVLPECIQGGRII